MSKVDVLIETFFQSTQETLVSKKIPTGRLSRRLATWLLICAMGFAALALGGVHREAIALVCGLAVASLVVGSWRAKSVPIDALTWVFLLLVLATVLQIIPVPMSWLHALAPATAETVTRSAEALGHDVPPWAAISLDPGATRLMAVWTIAILAAYISARQLAKRPDRQSLLLNAIPIIGCVVIGIGFIHTVFSLSKIYGLYEPSYLAVENAYGPLYTAPILNPNHLAAFLNLGIPVSLAMAANAETPTRTRAKWTLVFFFLFCGMALTMSRAGILCGIMASAIVIGAQRSRVTRAAALMAAGVLALLMLLSPLRAEMESLSIVDRVMNSPDKSNTVLGVEVAKRWPVTGAGRGAFPVAHTQVNNGLSAFTVHHAHNTPVQVVADYGLVIGGLALLLALLLIGPALWSALLNPALRGLACGLLAVGLHNQVDFSLDILAVALPAAVLVALIRRTGRKIRVSANVAIAGAVGLGLLATGLLVTSEVEHGPRRDARMAEAPVEWAAAHPGDAFAFLRAGVQEASVPMLRHASRLHPGDPTITLALASVAPLDEAFPLVRRALDLSWTQRIRDLAFPLIRRRAVTATQVLEALPVDGNKVAQYLGSLKPAPEALLAAARKRYPASPRVLMALGYLRLGQKQIDAVDDIATELIIGGDKGGYRLLGLVFRQRGDHLKAFHLFVEAGDPRSQLDAAEAALAAGQPDRALRVLSEARVGADQLGRVEQLRRRAKAQQADRDARGERPL